MDRPDGCDCHECQAEELQEEVAALRERAERAEAGMEDWRQRLADALSVSEYKLAEASAAYEADATEWARTFDKLRKARALLARCEKALDHATSECGCSQPYNTRCDGYGARDAVRAFLRGDEGER